MLGPQELSGDQPAEPIEGQGKALISKGVFQERAEPLGHQQHQEGQPAHHSGAQITTGIQFEKHQIAVTPAEGADAEGGGGPGGPTGGGGGRFEGGGGGARLDIIKEHTESR